MKALIRDLVEALGAPATFRASWSGFYGFGVGAGMPNVPDNGGWPYRTKTAEKVWQVAVKMIADHPEMSERELLVQAVKRASVRPLDLTPEDWRLLEMAIEWRKNGTKAIKNPRIGGAPGGPYNQTTDQAYGRELAGRGAP